jgi:hypothetical protein
VAAAELLVKLAEEQGVDLSQFSEQEVVGMINDLYKTAEEEGEKKEEKKENPFAAKAEEKKEEEKEKEKEKEAQAKFAEADFLGRVMAHAMVQELNSIDKEAGVVGRAAHGAGKALETAGKKITETVLRSGKGSAARLHPTTAKLIGGGTAAAGATGAALGAKKLFGGKKKEGAADESALEALAQQRTWDLAKEAGYVDEQGNLLVPEQQKEASALEQAVELRALQLLEGAGLPVELNQ